MISENVMSVKSIIYVKKTLIKEEFLLIKHKGFVNAYKNLVSSGRMQVPSNLHINLNMGLSLPPNVRLEEIPQQVQQTLQQMINQIAQNVQRLVQQEIIRQSPEVGIDIKVYGGKWEEYKEDVKS